MAQSAQKPKKLWGNPKVFLSATDLMIEERYYPLAQTRGAYVELMPEAPKAAQTEPQPDTRSGFKKIMTIIWVILVVIFVIVFISWWNDGYDRSSSGGSSRKYRLMLLSEGGVTVGLEHTNQKKLKEIASRVNGELSRRGIAPQTNPVSFPA